MLRDYREWLESELKLLGDASHHAYAFGQANMAKRAIEKLDAAVAGTVLVPLDPAAARGVLTALEALEQQTTAQVPQLGVLREAIREALAEE